MPHLKWVLNPFLIFNCIGMLLCVLYFSVCCINSLWDRMFFAKLMKTFWLHEQVRCTETVSKKFHNFSMNSSLEKLGHICPNGTKMAVMMKMRSVSQWVFCGTVATLNAQCKMLLQDKPLTYSCWKLTQRWGMTVLLFQYQVCMTYFPDLITIHYKFASSATLTTHNKQLLHSAHLALERST